MDWQRELMKGNTPTLVLSVLRDGPLHGYAIAREIERRSARALTCKEGTLYPALHALEQEGAIAGEWQQEAGNRRRRVYRLTPAGLAALEQRTRTWAEFASAIHRVLGGESHGGAGVPERDRAGWPADPTANPEPAG